MKVIKMVQDIPKQVNVYMRVDEQCAAFYINSPPLNLKTKDIPTNCDLIETASDLSDTLKIGVFATTDIAIGDELWTKYSDVSTGTNKGRKLKQQRKKYLTRMKQKAEKAKKDPVDMVDLTTKKTVEKKKKAEKAKKASSPIPPQDEIASFLDASDIVDAAPDATIPSLLAVASDTADAAPAKPPRRSVRVREAAKRAALNLPDHDNAKRPKNTDQQDEEEDESDAEESGDEVYQGVVNEGEGDEGDDGNEEPDFGEGGDDVA
jgi:hypothetical protein